MCFIGKELTMSGREINVDVIYGMAPPCTATFDPAQIAGIVVGELIRRVAHTRQATPEREHAALVLRSRLAENHSLDVAVSRGQSNLSELGRPVELNAVAIEKDSQTPAPSRLTVIVSESYRAG